jgi:hypothetical protein
MREQASVFDGPPDRRPAFLDPARIAPDHASRRVGPRPRALLLTTARARRWTRAGAERCRSAGESGNEARQVRVAHALRPRQPVVDLHSGDRAAGARRGSALTPRGRGQAGPQARIDRVGAARRARERGRERGARGYRARRAGSVADTRSRDPPHREGADQDDRGLLAGAPSPAHPSSPVCRWIAPHGRTVTARNSDINV